MKIGNSELKMQRMPHLLPWMKGIVPGGGTTYVHLSELIPIIKNSMEDLDEQIGADIVAKVWCLFV